MCGREGEGRLESAWELAEMCGEKADCTWSSSREKSEGWAVGRGGGGGAVSMVEVRRCVGSDLGGWGKMQLSLGMFNGV